MPFQQILDTDEEAFHLCETTCPLQRTKKSEVGSIVELKRRGLETLYSAIVAHS